jgi:hypothetical protein
LGGCGILRGMKLAVMKMHDSRRAFF